MISLTSPYRGPKRSPEQGQISIFFASSLIVLISIIAFVINIGLFVKAKINLQNATDAAAYSGAAVQARMLNRIGYLNWEMRNVYKEWMFKYYVLGNLNIVDVENASDGDTGLMDYGMQKDPNLSDALGKDVYNFPSVCIHYAGVRTNVCRRYAIPGIPRFEPTNLVGIDETTSSFIDAIVREKTDDCSKRSQLNYNVTTMWAYNIPTNDQSSNVFADAPQISADRPGAWPKAMELAIRIRSLENAVNRRPVPPICSSPGDGMPGCQTVTTLESEKHYGNERPVKAFWSAYRNIGNEDDKDMKSSFTLTELPPTEFSNFGENSLSTMLMPGSNIAKRYLDLKLQLVNLATFFTALISVDNTLAIQGQGVRAEGACDVSKIAVPVPAYPMGYYKNPDLVTYYAVRGEAYFSGLFNPFRSDKIKITAYAAAKPMGGRIGPALYREEGGTIVKSRNTPEKYRSSAYVSGLNLQDLKRKGTNQTLNVGEFAAGIPIPFNISNDPSGRFWISNENDAIGGWIDGQGIMFGVPNLVYDFVGSSMASGSYNSATATNIIRPNGETSTYGAGLYQKSQFGKFKSNLINADSPTNIKQSIIKARGPTRYEAANYTIPFPSGFSEAAELDTFGFVSGPEAPGENYKINEIYAPLHGAQGDALYKTADEVIIEVQKFLFKQTGAIKKYRTTMNEVARSIFTMNNGEYENAAKRISDYNFSGQANAENPRTCNSIAGAFIYLYLGSSNQDGLGVTIPQGCPEDLSTRMTKYFKRDPNMLDEIKPDSYRMEYTLLSANSSGGISEYTQLLTGFMPGGPGRGADERGRFSPPLSSGGTEEVMRRSGYSTKFISINSLRPTAGTYNQATANFNIYSEGSGSVGASDIQQGTFKNPLDKDALQIPQSVNH